MVTSPLPSPRWPPLPRTPAELLCLHDHYVRAGGLHPAAAAGRPLAHTGHAQV